MQNNPEAFDSDVTGVTGTVDTGALLAGNVELPDGAIVVITTADSGLFYVMGFNINVTTPVNVTFIARDENGDVTLNVTVSIFS